MNLCDRWLNNKVKSAIRGTEFSDEMEVRESILRCLRSVDECVFKKELDKLISDCTNVIACGGGYVTLM